MKVKFNTVMKDTKGEPIVYRFGLREVQQAMILAGVKRDEEVVKNLLDVINHFREDKDAKSEELTAAILACNALESPADEKVDGLERRRRAVLSERIFLAGDEPLEISKEDSELILKLVPKVDHRPVVYMRLERLFTAAQAEEDKADAKAAAKPAKAGK